MLDSQQLPLPAHHNQQLFADHYLNENLVQHPQWQALRKQARPVMQQITGILRDFIASGNERQTEEDLVMPVLRALGHRFEVQASLETPEGVKRPDYVFYRDADALAAHKNQVITDALPQEGGIAVGDAKSWGRALDVAVRQSTGDALSNKNPSYQIYYYMLHSGVTWGVLTNGRQWRLYHKDTAHKLDHFYEVDLPDLVESGDVGQFLYFYVFFRREAFEEGPLPAAEILRESADYARNVGNSLKGQVYDALRHIAQGFLDYSPNGLEPDPASLKAIYDNSLILLYRLIFILYAEARGLLPVRESKQYRDIYSLHAIKQAVAQDLSSGKHLLPDSARLWPQLRDLFDIINRGSPPLRVATFNGGLFDPRKHEFLTRYTVGDARLQQAIDKLARVNGAFVDYRDLSVRHMGTIYEGLLEYQLRPLTNPEDDWGVELVNDKGERKATGSYYTPDYIVKYIVEQAVGPVLERAVSGKKSDADKLRAVLKVNVLDPAMGSGHFLVEATEYIARFLVDLGLVPEGKTQEEADLVFWKRRVVQSCVYGVDLNPLAVELAKLSLWLTTVARDQPLSFLDHHLRPGNSLVGAQIAHLDLPAARKNGRARKMEQAQAAGQISLFGDSAFTQKISTAVRSMWLIEGSEASSVEQVKEQERLYDELRSRLVGRYSRLLNVVTAAQFGLSVDARHWPALVKYATANGAAAFPVFEKALDEAEQMAEEERFFHWELEFPEIYFDEFGRSLEDEAGFEAVIGNPPYVRQEQLAAYKPYFQRHFAAVYHGLADIFVYFFAQGLQQTRPMGRLSYISSNSWLRANYATPLRHHLRTAATVEQLVDLGDNRIFDEAPDVYPAIHIVRNEAPGGTHTARAAVFGRGEEISAFAGRIGREMIGVSIHDQDDGGWQLHSDAGRALFHKIMAEGRRLADVIGGRMYRGVLTGLNEAFIVDQPTRDRLVAEDPACSNILKPVLRGEDLRPWYQEDEGRWLIFARRGIDIDAYPSVRAHLAQFRERLEPRPDAWSGGRTWPGRKPGNYKWYEVQDSVDYYAAFDEPKILWPDIGKFPRFSLDERGYYLGNTGYMVSAEKRWLLGYLSSRCAWYVISHTSIALGERSGMNRYRLIDQYMRPLPVKVPPVDAQRAIEAMATSCTEAARDRYALHRRVRHRLHSDLGFAGKKLNQKLTAWWELDFAGLRSELKKVFGSDIPVGERDQWEQWFAERRAEHDRLTARIIDLETELNDRVYALFHLTPDEIGLVEESTRYRYGEV